SEAEYSARPEAATGSRATTGNGVDLHELAAISQVMFAFGLNNAGRDLPGRVQRWMPGVIELTVADEISCRIAVIDLRRKLLVGRRRNRVIRQAEILRCDVANTSSQPTVR